MRALRFLKRFSVFSVVVEETAENSSLMECGSWRRHTRHPAQVFEAARARHMQ